MVKTITQSLVTIVGRRPAPRPRRVPRHRIAAYVPSARTHPWFEQRAQRMLELGSRS